MTLSIKDINNIETEDAVDEYEYVDQGTASFHDAESG